MRSTYVADHLTLFPLCCLQVQKEKLHAELKQVLSQKRSHLRESNCQLAQPEMDSEATDEQTVSRSLINSLTEIFIMKSLKLTMTWRSGLTRKKNHKCMYFLSVWNRWRSKLYHKVSTWLIKYIIHFFLWVETYFHWSVTGKVDAVQEWRDLFSMTA